MANVTRDRVSLLMWGLMKLLEAAPDGMNARDALGALQQIVPPTEWEAGNFPSGGNRYEKVVRYSTIGLTKSGWLLKDHGVWQVGDVVKYLDGRVEVKVSKTAQYVRCAGMVTTAPKTRTSNRTVTLPPTLAQEMREYMARHPAAPDADTRPSNDAPLWCGRKTDGSYVADWAPTPSESKHRAPAPGYRPLNPDVPWEPSTWGKSVWRRAIALANQEGVENGEPPIAAPRLHDLRHTAASLILASGMNMHEVATALGHANSSITAKVYAHLLPTEVVRSSERYDAWMSEESTRAKEARERVTVLRRA